MALALLTILGFLLVSVDAVIDSRAEELRRQTVAAARGQAGGAVNTLEASLRQNQRISQIVRWTSLVVVLIPAAGILVFLSRLSRHDRERSAESRIRLSGETRDKEFTMSLLEAAMSSVPLGIAFISPDLRFIRVSAAFGAIHGKPPEWFVGKLGSEAVPKIAELTTPRFKSVLETGRPLMNVASTHGAYDELGPNRHWLSSYFPIRDASDGIIGVGVVLEDVTERWAIEEQFHHAQKMEAVARLASGVAHDFNNLLTIIRSYADILLLEEGMSEESLSELNEVRSAADRAAVLSRQLLTFTRQDVVAPRAIDVRPRLHGLQDMLTRIISKEVTLEIVVPEQLEPVEIDPGHLDQILMNLAVNAIDAMPKGGQLTITAARVDADVAGRVAGASAGPHIMLTVTDTGTGMDQTTLSRIFEPFFTTKSADKGTGLGLSTVYALTKQYRGFVQVESETDRGTTFRIYFPLAVARQDAVPRAPLKESPSGARRNAAFTILVLEADESACETLRRVLASRGYKVRTAIGQPDAERIIANPRQPIHLMLCDVAREEDYRHAWLERIVALHPETRFVVIADGGAEGAADAAPLPRSVRLQKPFTVDALVEVVREALSTGPPPLPPDPESNS